MALVSLNAFSQNFSFVFDGQTRNYTVHLPAGYNAALTYPLVFNFHGYTSNAWQQQLYSGMDAVADSNHFIVVYPDGLNNAWNVGFGLAPYNSGVDDVGFTNAMIDTLMAYYSINPNRVYACGMSNGGYFSHRLACELENRIAAVASVTGTLTDSTAVHCSTSRDVPVMQVHGTSDPVVNYNGMLQSYGVEATLNYWIGDNGCSIPGDTVFIANTNTLDLSTVERIRYPVCNGGSEVLFYKVINGGHTWPGGAIDIPTNGATNRDINCSSEIWKFFNRFTLQGPVGMEEEHTLAPVCIYPNPSDGEVMIGGTMPVSGWELMDMAGQKILSGTYSGTPLNIAALPSGVYLLQLMSATDTRMVKLVRR